MRLTFSETVTGVVTDGVLVATIDNPPVNAASADMRQGLFAAIDHVAPLVGATSASRLSFARTASIPSSRAARPIFASASV